MTFPHAGGGVPTISGSYRDSCISSPRTWGCTLMGGCMQQDFFIFPTRVGVYPITDPAEIDADDLPHACGGVPISQSKGISINIFPTPVGVYHLHFVCLDHNASFPHASGGVPENASLRSLLESLFPTHVGVYPRKRL